MIEYHTLTSEKFIDKIFKFRALIIAAWMLLVLVVFLGIDGSKLETNTNTFWLHDTAASFSSSDDISYISKISLPRGSNDLAGINRAKALEKQLKLSGRLNVDSLFDQHRWFYDIGGEGSEMLNIKKIKDLYSKDIISFAAENREKVAPYLDTESFHFYIYSELPIDVSQHKYLDAADIRIDQISTDASTRTFFEVFTLSSIPVLIFIILSLIFRNISAGISSLAIIASSTILSVFLIQGFVPGHTLHVSNIIIMLSISLLDYVYVYYRWHTTQYNKDCRGALIQAVNRNRVPALWTSLVTVTSLIMLVFVESDIIKSMVLSILFPSVISYLLNFSLLPSILSYFTIKNSYLLLHDFYKELASRILRSNKTILFVIAVVAVSAAAFFVFEYSTDLRTISAKKIGSANIISYEMKSEEGDLASALYKSILLEEELLKNFEQIKQIRSTARSAYLIIKAKHPELSRSEIVNLMSERELVNEAIFFMEIYGINVDEMSVQTKVMITDPKGYSEIVHWLGSNKSSITFSDIESSVAKNKFSHIHMLFGSALFGLLAISFFIGIIFKKRRMLFGTILVNTIPILLFVMIMIAFGQEFTIEAFISIAISLAISSDATIHFTYTYWRNRYYEQTKAQSMKMMFLFAGTPVLVSTFILVLSFSLLVFSKIEPLVLIGTYTSVLILMSLLVNFLILPVIIHSSDGDNS